MKLFPRLQMTRRPGLALAAALLLAAAGAFAASEDGHREHDPHEHGHGALDIALEGENLVAEFRIPAVNVVGFEHAPRDDAEREAVHEAVVRFANAAAVLVPAADAECEIEDAEVEIAGTDHDGPWRVGAEGEAEEGHEGEGHEQEEEEHEEEEGHEEEAHSELHATYRFHCRAPERLARIDVLVFELLHDAEEIGVRVVTATTQTAMDLHPGEAVVELSP